MYSSYYFQKIRNKSGENFIFLDRDGVLNKDTGYIDKISRVEILYKNIKYIKEVIENKSVKNPIFIIVSNQSGVARGYFSIKIAFEIMNFIVKKIENEIPISAFYFSPYHPSASNLFVDPVKANSFRKPNPGMFLQAQNDYRLSLKDSIMIGDRTTDKIAAIESGISKNNIFILGNQQ